jgi:hypothetical protein
MAAYEYDDFWVEFSRREGGGYHVTLRAPGGQTATETFHLPFTADELTRAVRTIGYTRSQRPDVDVRTIGGDESSRNIGDGGSARDIGDVKVDPRLSAEQFGDRLAKALLEGPARDLYVNARNTAVAQGRGVRLWLSLKDAPGLMSVPWEFLYLQPTFLASQRKTPIVRFLQTDAPVQPRHIEKSVEMLGVIASPIDLPPLNVEEERKRVDDALAKVRETRDVNVTWLDPATPSALLQALQTGDYHILHFVGHSGFTGDEEAAVQAVTDDGISEVDPGGVIYLEDENRGKVALSDSQLVTLLGDQNLRLVVLNSCEGARSSALDPFAGIAPAIVGLGVPAVLAMQFEISDNAAIKFADEFYQSLIAREEPIDVAVADARKAVFTLVNQTEWATPVLFLRNADGRIFDFEPPPLVVDDDPKTAWEGFKARVRALPPAVVAGVLGVAAVGVLGGLALAGVIGGPGASQSPGPSGSVIPSPTATVEPTVEPTVTPTESAGASSSPTAGPSGTPTIPTVPGTGEWAGPRAKSNMLAVSAGPSTDARNVSAVAVPVPGATAMPASEGSNRAGVVDSDPAWDPHANVIAFARLQAGQQDIRYVVPGGGQTPDGVVDKGIAVKDPMTNSKAGRHDHLPVWRGDRNLLFARALGCLPGPKCPEDIRLATFEKRTGDYIAPISGTSAYSQEWRDLRSIAVDPRDDGRILVTGINVNYPLGPTFGVWLVTDDGVTRQLLPGSTRAMRAIFAADGSIVAIDGGRDGAGRTILRWPARGRGGDPVRTEVATLVGSSLPADTQFASIALSPTGDGRFAVLATDRASIAAGRPPRVAILDPDLNVVQVVDPVPPETDGSPIVWNVITGLAW